MNAVAKRTLTAEDSKRILARFKDVQIVGYDEKYRDAVIAGAREIHADSIYADMPIDEAKLIKELGYAGIEVPDRYFRLAVKNGVPIGGFFGYIYRTFFCDELIARDMGWWVLKEHRNTPAAILLLLHFEGWARRRGAWKVQIGQSGRLKIEETFALFRHCGYEFTGYNCVKDIHG